MKTEILLPTAENIFRAAAEIRSGGLVAFPTETVYGLGGDALNPLAAVSIFEAKGRPSDNPLIVHLADKADIETVAFLNENAQTAAEIFMPGPLTIILKKRDCVPSVVTGGLDAVAVRIPNHDIAQRFLSECKTPIAAPSANTSTRPSPTRAAHVFEDLNGKIRYILEGGSCEIGLESTIIDLSGERVRLLRRGGISLESLETVFGEIEVYSADKTQAQDGDRPLCPGMKYRHYAPRAKVRLFDFGDKSALLAAYKRNSEAGIKTLALVLNAGGDASILASQNHAENMDIAASQNNESGRGAAALFQNLNGADIKATQDVVEQYLVEFNSAEEYANALFFQLRRADELGCSEVFCELAEASGIGESINNRLFKAAT